MTQTFHGALAFSQTLLWDVAAVGEHGFQHFADYTSMEGCNAKSTYDHFKQQNTFWESGQGAADFSSWASEPCP